MGSNSKLKDLVAIFYGAWVVGAALAAYVIIVNAGAAAGFSRYGAAMSDMVAMPLLLIFAGLIIFSRNHDVENEALELIKMAGFILHILFCALSVLYLFINLFNLTETVGAVVAQVVVLIISLSILYVRNNSYA